MRRLLAVTRETLKECLRTRVAAVFVALLAACLVGIALGFKGDGTLPGRIRTFLAYSVVLTQLLLAIVTVLLTVGIVTGDIHRKSIFIVISKPLARWQYVIGRWLGVVALDAILLAVAGAGIYGMAQALRRLPTQVEQKKALKQLPPEAYDPDRRAIDEQVFAARAAVRPDPLDVESAVQAKLQQSFDESGKENLIREAVRADAIQQRQAVGGDPSVTDAELERLAADPEVRRRVLDRLTEEIRKAERDRRLLVAPGRGVRITFSGLPARQEGSLQLDYRLQPVKQGVEAVYSMWVVQRPDTGETLPPLWRTDATDTGSTLSIPAQAVAPNGTLTLVYLNDVRTGSPVKVSDANLSLYYRIGGFEDNFLRALGIAMLRLVFLAAAGVLAGVCLSFPMAVLTGMVVLTVGIMGPFILESTRLLPGDDASAFDLYCHYATKVVFYLVPHTPVFSSPSDELADGVWISAARLAKEAYAGTGVRALVLIALACLAFHRRELARVQV